MIKNTTTLYIKSCEDILSNAPDNKEINKLENSNHKFPATNGKETIKEKRPYSTTHTDTLLKKEESCEDINNGK